MKGKVYLVGAGPGDYGLLTLKGLECIKKADVIVYDRLVNEEYLKDAKAECEMIYVGKVSSNHTLTQEQINNVIVQEALKGKMVTRLKGGDPYVFGRGGEEGEYLLGYDVPFEVVPGITSAIGGLCYAGIPITHRDYTSSFHVVTGHLKDDENTSINWHALARMGGTIVFLMGVSNLEKICGRLMDEGMNQEISVAIINWATRPNQKVVTGNLMTICEVAKREEVTSPSLIVVGEVVRLRKKLNFFEQKLLFGKTVVTTRARVQSSGLVEQLKDLGAKVIEAPTIKIEPIEENTKLNEAIEVIQSYTYLIFTSQNAVKIFFEALTKNGLDSRALAYLKIAVIGEATKKLLVNYGIQADIVPSHFVAESLCEELLPLLQPTDKILIPTAQKTRTILQDKLGQVCKVDQIDVYCNVPDLSSRDLLLNGIKKGNIDYITFTSSSTVKNFIELLGKERIDELEDIKLISIGEITSKTMEELGLKVYLQPQKPLISDLVSSIIRDALEE